MRELRPKRLNNLPELGLQPRSSKAQVGTNLGRLVQEAETEPSSSPVGLQEPGALQCFLLSSASICIKEGTVQIVRERAF